jgi:uncharacterized damage-inducible protein DinB
MSVFTNSAASAPEEIKEYVGAVLGLVGEQDPMEVLRNTPDRLAAAIAGLSPAALRQPESDGKWSIVQVLQHLADSEIVWAWRLRLTLAQDRPPLTGYDQDAWASRLRYADADPEMALHLFTVVRQANVAVLASASPEDRQRVGVHAERGEETVEHLLHLYAGHDLLHINQLARIRTAVTGAT